ncbi:FAD-binding oxidoreductase [Sandaracinobacteroides saxicola]|uniref:FAD-binding oxidoreductase n=1 Tax=Sandaracinobacteroides saxicola TaxID=2759707 RepID=A0A7G5II81_9SPHN|nr:FAD-binding oxidoreductase [Sandaracinobacteroides saxicola]QMW23073.1 FAD-binding oxidoreductase [Sandaracinobacteroides saxicola]
MATVLAEVRDGDGLAQRLRQLLGNDHVLVDEASRAFYSTDLSWRPREVAAMVARPGSVEELAATVGAATEAGFAVVARGGGMSYTSGYTPERRDTVLLDTRRLNRVIEVNTEDMYVLVEAGCTWKELHEALAPHGVQTPYWGPLSGAYATVGGALSQNSLFHGSGIGGTAAESVLGLKVVLGDGQLLTTGSWAHRAGNPFWRHFGPDLTGLFTADTGAFGVKAVAALRLVTAPKHTGYLSYKFDTLEAMLAAQVKIARLGIASECYGFDPYYNGGFEKQGITFEEGLSIVGKIARKGGLKGLKAAAKLALGGKRILKDVPYSLHMTLDAHTELVAAEHTDMAAEICAELGGTEMANSIPTVFRGAPFGGVRTILLGSEGEIWIPVHGYFPLSRAIPAAQATERFLAERRDLMDQWGIKTSYLTCFSGPEFVIEPSFYWHDELGEFRLSLIEPEFAEKWKDIPANEARRAVALKLRDELRDLFDSLGGLHLQIGKYYPYTDIMNNAPLARVVRGVKEVLDPQGLVNPGSLGLR